MWRCSPANSSGAITIEILKGHLEKPDSERTPLISESGPSSIDSCDIDSEDGGGGATAACFYAASSHSLVVKGYNSFGLCVPLKGGIIKASADDTFTLIETNLPTANLGQCPPELEELRL
ncbi:hypothetical protein NPIL_417881 [Nephila pilipes]|uniref:Uncharacterized protein n=1 Tax=Nephila pilipes TaxID=299642 RepID=A0A8X6N8D5_NEPPI|nr:hypothetical protein NPIL_417881 [Nephila pilipes]